MNCTEIAARLETTLIHERDLEWIRGALRHAEQCPSCAHLVKLHELELLLTELPAVSPSSCFVEGVMDRIGQPGPLVVDPHGESARTIPRFVILFLGAVLLAAAYLVPAPGSSWLGDLNPLTGLIRPLGIIAYLANHPPGAVLLASVASLLILLGLSLPEKPIRETA
jgi:hypothetical protein